MTEQERDDDLAQVVEEIEDLRAELSFLFGDETVKLAEQIDIADLNLKDEIVGAIADGVGELKKLRGNPQAQIEFVSKLEQGSRLLLCMWIMDMDLLSRIQTHSYIK